MSDNQLVERCLKIGKYIIDNSSTVRETAERFNLSKSTVHKDATEKLNRVDPEIYLKVRKVLEINKAERHIRGGEATRIKYLNKNK